MRSKNALYILGGPKGHDQVACPDIKLWEAWVESADRIVKQTTSDTGILVSTVFLAVSLMPFLDRLPKLFETMIFGGKHDNYQTRYLTWDEAEAGHEAAIKLVFEGEPGEQDV